MKNYRLILWMLPLLMLSAIHLTAAVNRQDALEAVLSALKKGNAADLVLRFEETVELTLPDQSGSNAKPQCLAQLSKFFAANPVSTFELKHKGKSPSGSYAMGTLKTEKANFRVNIFLRGKGGKELVRELRIQTMD
jgi:hypothetical protein